MTANRTVMLLVILALAVATTGCSTRVRDTDAAPDFGEQLAAMPIVGVTTVTVDPVVEGIFTDADQADADDVLFGAFVAAERGLDVWHPATVQEFGGAATLAVLTDEYARLGRLRADQIRALAVPLGGCRFLAFGRLTEDRVRTLAQNQTTSDPVARADGQAEHGDPWSSIASVERQVRVTLEIFDLASGESVWRAEATSKEKQLYEYDDRVGSDPNEYLKQRLATVDGPVFLSRHGDALKLPDLVVLMRKAFTKLVEQLPGARS